MKQFKLILIGLLLVVGTSSLSAQDKNNTIAIGIGSNAVDFYPTNAGLAGHGTWFSEYFNTGDHYNVLPAISRITASKYLADGFSVEAAGSLNKISKVGDNNVSDLSYFGLDGAVKYDLNEVIGETSFVDPYALVGGGYTWMDNYGTGTFNGGIGINFWFNQNIGLNLESKYKHTFESAIVQHFQHSFGVVIKFGGNDKDGDGVYDTYDACPEVFGLSEYNGCPDSDNDGIIDSKDDCPNVAGIPALNGCPDTDGDGIADKDDACPTEKGTKANNGCPDTDGDGVVDKNDACPNVAGPIENKGCPWPDTDGDGVLDKDDDCINVAGPASNKGCPEITKTEVAKLEELFKTVYFDTGKSTFKKETFAKLDEAAVIMSKFSTAKFTIEGHTDSVGGDARNLELSQSRATAVKDYLVSKGVSSSNLDAKGYGEKNPIATNMNRAGRAQNRRVDVKLVN
ncbi:OmpA family protein [Lutibacter sp.]|uniref:OmpA family protein n=1 Tax=Lutibacter sp. TaxID=1925666 RepID=UPI001A2D2BC1|nr:OmpA family protein [Lutibacter sp.]MBI9040800.1 OmpA family protein [Lutibacter sp.]